MMKTNILYPYSQLALCLITWLFLPLLLKAELQSSTVFSDSTLIQTFTAKWLMHPSADPQVAAVYYFRKNFALPSKPTRFLVHLSADNHYRLFVNGRYVCRGPARGDLNHWFYETVDLAPYLQAGQNTLAAEVVNWGPKRQFTQFSQMSSFWLQGQGPAEALVNTDPNAWKVYHNPQVHLQPVDWIFDKKSIAFGLYVASPTDSVVATSFPWGWEQAQFDDSRWPLAKWNDNAGGRNTQAAGGILYSGGKSLIPRRTPMLREEKELLASVVRCEGIPKDEAFIQGKGALVIPAQQQVLIWIDQRVLTVGYPELSVSGGKGAHIRIRYAETLFKTPRTKGNRNELEGKNFIGIKDVFMPDGGAERVFKPTYLRNFRFIQLEISTQNEPLLLNSYFNVKCTADIELQARFECDDPQLNQLMAMGWRTASLCAQDILSSDAYYEQMQYVGDARVHNLSLLTLSGQDALTRNALIQFDESRIPEGLTYACYPNPFHLIIPSYSLIFIDQLHDYLLWKDDKAFLQQFDLGMYSVLDWFEKRIQPNGLLGPIEWWPALAWPKDYKNGVPPEIEKGNNALYTLHYAYTLRHAAEIYRFIGKEAMAQTCLTRANRCNLAVKKWCFDPAKGLFKESPTLQQYAQITNIMGILSGAVSGTEANQVLQKVLHDTSLSGQVDLFLHLYLFEALNKLNANAAFFSEISEWRTMIERGMTTFVEVPLEWGEEGQRSECHPWSTIPNTHFFKTICGIRPTAPGHRRIEIAPELGPLKSVNARYPHPKGAIELDLKVQGNTLRAQVVVPSGMQAVFRWKGQVRVLKPGAQQLVLSSTAQ
jgi:hypothetical protein